MFSSTVVWHVLIGCGPGQEDADVVEPGVFGSAQFAVVATEDDQLSTPRDLAFHPDFADELWVVNQDTDSVVVLFSPGTGGQESQRFKDPAANHFMEEVSSLAMGVSQENESDGAVVSTFASCQETRNTYDDSQEPDDFMGPVLWPAEVALFAEDLDGPLGSHLDMLHQSPFCMGIEHDHDNVFWVFDGGNDMLTWYDFQEDHGFGNDDHGDGMVRRYAEVELDRVAQVPGHLVLDRVSNLLYIANTGEGTIVEVDARSGKDVGAGVCERFEPLEDCTEFGNVTFRTLVTGLVAPSGIALDGAGHLFVSDHDSGEIIAFDLAGAELDRVSVPEGAGVMGLEVGPDGSIWYAHGGADVVGHLTF